MLQEGDMLIRNGITDREPLFRIFGHALRQQYQSGFLQMQVCVIDNLTSNDGLDMETACLILLLRQA